LRRVAPATAVFCVLLACIASRPALALDHIKINYVEPAPYYDPLFLAIDAGFFAEEGIEAETVQAGGGVATPALIAGDLAFSTSGSVAISAIMKGAKLKVLFVTSDRPAFELWAQPDIKTVEDLKDKQVGIITRGDTSEIAMRYYITKHGLPADYISYTPLGTGPGRVAGIVSGTYPAVLLGVSEMAQLKATGKYDKLHRLADLSKDVRMVFSGLAASDAMIRGNPDLVNRVLRALLKGMRETKASRADAVAAMVKRGADPATAGAQWDDVHDLLSDNGRTTVATETFELQLRSDLLGIPRDQVMPASSVFDFGFVDQAATALDAEHWRPQTGKP
jgi:NitT/TauT family transport system substrate-binding protein